MNALKAILAVGTIAVLASAASAASVGVNFYTTGQTTRDIDAGLYAGVESQTNWNNWALPEYPTLHTVADVADSGGTTTNMDVTYSVVNGAHTHLWAQETPGGDLSTGDNQLMGCGEDGGLWTSDQGVQLILVDVPYATYDLIIYAGRHNSLAGNAADLKFSISGQADEYLRTVGFDGTFTESTAATAGELDTVGAADYIRFTGLTGDVSVLMSEVAQVGGNFNQGGGWSGFQVVEAASDPIPEPATMSLLAIGGLAALIKRRRRS